VVNLNTAATEEYNGATWTPSNNLVTARQGLGAAGTQTAALGFGGFTTANTGATEEYDGNSWTNSPNMITARRYFRRNRNSNSSISIWWYYIIYQQVQEYSSNRRI
jgi:hypothetical protein